VQSELNHEAIFDAVYAHQIWGAGSGTGSTPEATTVYREFLHNFMQSNAIRSVLDLGCGDWQFSQLIDWSGIDYVGVDVSGVVLANVRHFERPGIRFRQLNAVTDPLPPADLLIAKDVLQHWSNDDILSLIPKLAAFPHILVTNGFPANNMHEVNADVGHRGKAAFRPVNLSDAPFNVKGAFVAWYCADEPKWVYHATGESFDINRSGLGDWG
jgi:SAM-dependent methyltransferase